MPDACKTITSAHSESTSGSTSITVKGVASYVVMTDDGTTHTVETIMECILQSKYALFLPQ